MSVHSAILVMALAAAALLDLGRVSLSLEAGLCSRSEVSLEVDPCS